MVHERFIDKKAPPSDEEMIDAIGPVLADAWGELRRFVVETYDVVPFLQCGGPRYGWNLQHRKGGRPLCELYPEHESFTAMIVLGKKEIEQALARLESFGPIIRQALTETPRYHDGCWMYIRISDPATCRKDVKDFEELVMIKRKPPAKKQEG
jgi:hypothetical protein